MILTYKLKHYLINAHEKILWPKDVYFDNMNFKYISISSKFDLTNRKRGWERKDGESEKCNKQCDKRGKDMN